MFKLTIGQTKYNVYFRYRPVPDRRYERNHTIPLRKTECYIESVADGSNKINETVVVMGETVQSRQDNFCRATGRKIALARALANLTSDRAVRQIFWAAYHCRMSCQDQVFTAVIEGSNVFGVSA